VETDVPLFSRSSTQADPDRVAAAGIGAYFQPPAGHVEKVIAVTPIRLVAPVASSHQALGSYEVRDFGRGLSAFESLMAHVLRQKFRFKKRPRRGLWPQTVSLQLGCAIHHLGSGQPFDKRAPASVADIDAEFASREPERIGDINAYAEALVAGEDLGTPVYVSGAVLNRAMGRNKAEARGMYMLDGARRLTAAALAHRTQVTVKLIIAEEQLPDFIGDEPLDALRTKLEGLAWFENYQSLPLVGLSGERSLQRFSLMDIERLRDQLVLDFGCNVGGAALKAVQSGARRVVGIEGMIDTCSLAQEIGSVVGFENLSYLNVNFNDADFDAKIDAAVAEQADYSFFFSVYRTKELTQRERLFRYIIDKTRHGIFFEGHADPEIDSIAYHDWLFECFGLRGTLLGYSEGKLRPLFYLDVSGEGS
jgi:SAM-dependent methyltransferase